MPEGVTVEGTELMDPLLMLGGLAVIIGVIGVFVLLKGRKKSLNEKNGPGSANRHRVTAHVE